LTTLAAGATVMSMNVRVLVVAAHPDDAEYAVAGSVARWVDEGAEVAYCVVTRGETGGFDATPRDQLPALREAEQRAAARAVGVGSVTFLDFPDGRVAASEELRRALTREIRRFRPDRVVCHSPQRDWQRILAAHPDHLACGEATLCAVYPDARNRFAHPQLLAEGLEPWSVPEVWMVGAPAREVNRWVDVTETFDRKLAALHAHASQTAHIPGFDDRQRERAATVAAAGHLPDGRFAEAFHVIDARTP
jgi:LmbE family N-acetylglucosaminyl deacetylase